MTKDIVDEDWLISLCDAAWILESRESETGPVGRLILQSARHHLESQLRGYLTNGCDRP